MFLEKYLDKEKLNLLYDVYEEWYINELDENNFIKIYDIFKEYKFYFIDDIILNYLEVFTLEPVYVKKAILNLYKEFGSNFVNIIGNDMRLLEKILDNNIN